MKWRLHIGPATLVAAAFIGPGTVTVCSLAGVIHGYALLWALLVAVIFTIVLQEMAARWGVISGKGLAAGLIEQASSKNQKLVWMLLIGAAIFVGNAAYEAGNISGGVLGLESLVPNSSVQSGGVKLNYWSWLIGLIAAALLYAGKRFLNKPKDSSNGPDQSGTAPSGEPPETD